MSTDAEHALRALAHEAEVQVGNVRLEMCERREIRYCIVHTARRIFEPDESVIADIVGDRKVFLVVDENVHSIYGDALEAHARHHLRVADVLPITGQEANKTWHQAELICNAAMECGLGRNDVIVGVGGGVVLDVTGFAASIYRRGIGYLRIPTTLIGQVDVSVGVKQGINSGGRKNVLGSFYPPLASINDVGFLETLPALHITSGLAEILKMAVLTDPVLFSLVELHGAELVARRFQEPSALARTIMIRAETAMLRELKGNLFETNHQRTVDFGHTFSVALETDSAYTLPHGHAVGLDMLISTCLAVSRALCPPRVLERMMAVYRRVQLPLSQQICSAKRLFESLSSVRDHRGSALNLVVPRDIGSSAFLQDITTHELESACDFLAGVQERYDRPGF